LLDYDGPEPQLLKNESLTDAILRLQRRGRELKADMNRITSAPYPSSYAKQQMRAQIEALAMQGAPDVADVIEHDRKVVWPTQRVQSSVLNTGTPAIAFAEMPDTLALVAWLHRDALFAALDREIVTESDDDAALTPEARQQQEAEMQGDLLAVEREESALVWRAMDERLPVEHRNDCSPQATLQLSLIASPRTNNGSLGSSAIHAWDIVRGRR
jgi:hypothetical protein